MKDLNQVIGMALEQQPAVSPYSLATLKRRARRRRRQRFLVGTLVVLSLGSLGLSRLLPAGQGIDTVADVAESQTGEVPLVGPGSISVRVCPAAPDPQTCGQVNEARRVSSLVLEVNRAAPITATDCTDPSRVALTVEFVRSRGEEATVIDVDGCGIASKPFGTRTRYDATDFSKQAGSYLREAPAPSSREGCRGLVDDMTGVALGLDGWPGRRPQEQTAQIQRLESRVAVAGDLSAEQRDALRVLPEVLNDILLGNETTHPDAALRNLLDELRVICPQA